MNLLDKMKKMVHNNSLYKVEGKFDYDLLVKFENPY